MIKFLDILLFSPFYSYLFTTFLFFIYFLFDSQNIFVTLIASFLFAIGGVFIFLVVIFVLREVLEKRET